MIVLIPYQSTNIYESTLILPCCRVEQCYLCFVSTYFNSVLWRSSTGKWEQNQKKKKGLIFVISHLPTCYISYCDTRGTTKEYKGSPNSNQPNTKSPLKQAIITVTVISSLLYQVQCSLNLENLPHLAMTFAMFCPVSLSLLNLLPSP